MPGGGMERNTVSEGLLIRYDVRNGRYKPNYGRVTGTEHAMGTYTPRILRGTEFYIGPPSTPQAVQTLASAAVNSDISRKGNNSRQKKVYVIRNEDLETNRPTNELKHPEAENTRPQFQNTEIFKLFEPLFYLLAVFGLFYPTSMKHCRHGNALSKCYGLFVVVVLWGNVFRLLSCLSPSEWKKPGVVLKLSILGWFIHGAVSALFCFWAWNSNSFAELFLQWNAYWERDKPTFKSRRHLRSTSLGCSICGYVLLLTLLTFCLYATFNPDEIFVIDRVSLRNCPVNFGTGSVLLTVIFTLALIFTTAAWILPLVQLYLVCVALTKEYQHLNHTLRTAIDVDNSVHRCLEDFRQRHLFIGHLTLTVDHMMSFYSSVTFLVNSATFLALMGDLCLHSSTGSDARLASAVLMTMSAFVLLVFLYACTCVSTCSQSSLLTLLKYKVVSGSSENAIQVSLFLCQLTSRAWGLSVLRLFTVNKSTVLCCLCVLFLYLAVLIHILPVTSEPLSGYAGENGTNVTYDVNLNEPNVTTAL